MKNSKLTTPIDEHVSGELLYPIVRGLAEAQLEQNRVKEQIEKQTVKEMGDLIVVITSYFTGDPQESDLFE